MECTCTLFIYILYDSRLMFNYCMHDMHIELTDQSKNTNNAIVQIYQLRSFSYV